MMKRSFGRRVQFDERSRNFPIRELIPAIKRRSYTWRCGIVLDQGNEGSCTGMGVSHEAAARPVEVIGINEKIAREVYYRARQLDEWPGECVDIKTQCLSSKGWVGPDELFEGDEILGFNLEEEGLRWAKVRKVHYYENLKLREWKHDQLSVSVTDNHKWVVKNRLTHGGYELIETTNLKTQHEIPRASICLDQPSNPTVADDIVQLVAWAITEGHYRNGSHRGNCIDISQKNQKSAVTELMKRLRVARGYEKTDGCHVWNITGELAKNVREIAPNKVPSVNWFRILTKRQLRLFVDTCILADGHITPGEKWGRLDRTVFSQKKGEILNAFLIACTLAGIPVSRACESGGTNNDVETWGLRKSNFTAVRKLLPGPYYSERAWCPETSLGTFVAKRGGYIFITGNSYEGSSVLAAMKAGQDRGWYKSYRWAFGEEDLAFAVGYKGPAVLGINWFEGMSNPDEKGIIKVAGVLQGGHAILCNGYNVKTNLYRLHNSWGSGWGINGEAFISGADMADLLAREGEAAIPVIRGGLK